LPTFRHPAPTRRAALQAGAVGLLGLGTGELAALRAADPGRKHPAKSVIFLFLSGGLGQHDSFDPKPDAPADVRGEFAPIPTATPGVRICEHLPLLAARSDRWAVVRSLTHPSNDHSTSHHIMLTGRSDVPAGFSRDTPRPTDHPSVAAVAGAVLPPRNNLPPAVVLPEKLVHNSGRVLPGQFAGVMGRGATRGFWRRRRSSRRLMGRSLRSSSTTSSGVHAEEGEVRPAEPEPAGRRAGRPHGVAARPADAPGMRSGGTWRRPASGTTAPARTPSRC
jgi:hypothetical protein